MIVGIDPGFKGAVAFLKQNGELQIFDLPIKLINKRKRINTKVFSQHLKKRIDLIRFAVIEDVSAMPGEGVASTFRFGFNTGLLFGALETLDIKLLPVKPSVWKPGMGLSRDKKKSLVLAKQSFPVYKHYFSRAMDDGRAEAALLAKFAFDNLV